MAAATGFPRALGRRFGRVKLPMAVSFAKLDEVLSGPSRDGQQTILVSMTAFGGHEHMLLRHLGHSAGQFQIVALSDIDNAVESLRRALPSNCKFICQEHHPAYPPLRSISVVRHWLRAIRTVGSLPTIALVSAGDVGNHYHVRLLLALKQRGLVWTYVPMPPVRLSLGAKLGRLAARWLLTISSHEAAKFHPPAQAVLQNLSPGHLSRLGRQAAAEGASNIYWIGRLESYQKRPTRALDVLQATLKIGANVRLHFVGDGGERAALEHEVRSRGLQPYVRFWGWINFESETIPPLPPIGALLNTSDFEGLPLTLLDAFDIGVPCVVRYGAVTDPEVMRRVHLWHTPEQAAAIIVGLVLREAA